MAFEVLVWVAHLLNSSLKRFHQLLCTTMHAYAGSYLYRRMSQALHNKHAVGTLHCEMPHATAARCCALPRLN